MFGSARTRSAGLQDLPELETSDGQTRPRAPREKTPPGPVLSGTNPRPRASADGKRLSGEW